jgi:hypothetical protein
MNDHVKSAFDLASFAVIGATLVEWLSAVAALFTVYKDDVLESGILYDWPVLET